MHYNLECETRGESRQAHRTYEHKQSQSPSPEDLDPESRFLIVPDHPCMRSKGGLLMGIVCVILSAC